MVEISHVLGGILVSGDHLGKHGKETLEVGKDLGTARSSETLVVAIGVVFGSQILRVLFPLIGWYLRDTRKHDTFATIAPFILGPFVLGWAASSLTRRLPARGSLLAAGGGLLLARLTLQVSSLPAVEFVASVVGVFCFVWFLSFSAGFWRGSLTIGLLAGLGVDTWLKGLAGTLDLSWMSGIVPLVIALALAATWVYLLRFVWRQGRLDSGPIYAQGRALFGIGPWLFLNALILQNQGWVATVIGWSPHAALLLIMVGNVGALWLAIAGHHRSSSLIWTLLFLVATAVSTRSHGLLFSFAVLLALAGGAHYLSLIVGEYGPPQAQVGGRGNLSLNLGLLALATLVMLYYGSLGIRLPLGQQELTLVAVLLLGAALVVSNARGLASTYVTRSPRLVSSAYLVALAVPWLIGPALLLLADALRPPPPPTGGEGTIRLMTYNIHSAYNTAGRQDPAAIAAVIAEAGADVVAFQEISRGWLLNGSTDLVTWLDRRLDMPYVVFASTLEDPLWGNAIMSRFPIIAHEAGLLPRRETLIGRGYLRAQIDVGFDQQLLVIDTHLSDAAEDLSALHLEQVETIVETWAGQEPAVLVGDMNSEPGSAEMDILLDEGFRDAWEAGTGPGFTSPAIAPDQRIDWVFHTDDLAATGAEVVVSQASDHFPVAVSIRTCGADC